MATRSKSTSNAFRISSDGYVEFYKYRAKSLIDNDYQVFTYNQKPASYAKINHTLVKGSKTYLYYGYNLKGINDKRARTSGAYKYRLTIHNLHTPYRYTTRGGHLIWQHVYNWQPSFLQYSVRIRKFRV